MSNQATLSSAVEWDAELIKKYNYSGPRYTSYPTALEFHTQYSEQDFLDAVASYPERNLSLYIHIPFCHKLCYFCACNKIVTKQHHKADRYLDELEKEISQRAALFKHRLVTQMHWGGGTPTFLSQEQISRLVSLLKTNFHFADGVEMSIEVDPREITLDTFDHLRKEGFNRLSIGIQDFDKNVQELINRQQNERFIHSLFDRARHLGFSSINVDLIYGLPKQSLESFRYTLDKVIELNPDRLSVFNYAHLPERFAAQRKIKYEDLGTAQDKLAILQATIQTLTDSGYQFIGMDHFAKPDDPLAIAQRDGCLHRNFQGYTTHGDTDLLGLGVSAISMLGNHYSQNQKELNLYYQALADKGNGLWKGFVMSEDDCIRREVIKTLICNFNLDIPQIETRCNIDFHTYFKEDLDLLKPFIHDGLVNYTPQQITVTPKGRLLIRNICMCFDFYLREHALRQNQFSRVI